MPKINRVALSVDQREELDRRLRACATQRREYERLRMVWVVANGATIPQAAARRVDLPDREVIPRAPPRLQGGSAAQGAEHPLRRH